MELIQYLRYVGNGIIRLCDISAFFKRNHSMKSIQIFKLSKYVSPTEGIGVDTIFRMGNLALES
jgi:hypothetical protein